MNYIVEYKEILMLIGGIAFFALLLLLKFGRRGIKSSYYQQNVSSRKETQNWVNPGEFQEWKRKIKPNCTELDFIQFREFLTSYGGGFVKRSYGQIVCHEFLVHEKGDLKGIFYNIIVPNPHIDTVRKEEFRSFLIGIGVNGVEKRPDYETRDAKLKNKAVDADEYARKAVGNSGEQIVRDILAQLDSQYRVINGPIIKYQDVCHEFDHIVVGYNGVFVIETKAFGMTDGVPCKAGLFIDEGDKWIVRKNKINREVESPTGQILEEQKLLGKLLAGFIADVQPIIALSNTEMNIKNNITLPYEVIRADKLIDYIKTKPAYCNETDVQTILTSINNCRQN